MRNFVLFLLLVVFFNKVSLAHGIRNNRETIFRCRVTENSGHLLPIPKKINKNNNLTRDTKSLFFSKGKSIVLEGYILDKNCVPIPNSTISIWQKNYFDVNQDGIKAKELRNNPEKLNKFDSSFVSNGSATSDNTGFYSFILSKPCKDCMNSFDFSIKDESKRFKFLDSFATFSRNDGKIDRLAQYNRILSKDQNLTLEEELRILCETTDNNDKKNNILINSGNAFAKFIGIRKNQEVYRMDIVLDGQNFYRKY